MPLNTSKIALPGSTYTAQATAAVCAQIRSGDQSTHARPNNTTSGTTATHTDDEGLHPRH